ncbi:hypothetical protein [Sorangium sp. So ce131]|uniref:hypothetical protein n=1 Tax=Sorangium sp. So ce131 TaxID=3133282 RepID=UPI003F630BE5
MRAAPSKPFRFARLCGTYVPALIAAALAAVNADGVVYASADRGAHGDPIDRAGAPVTAPQPTAHQQTPTDRSFAPASDGPSGCSAESSGAFDAHTGPKTAPH